MTPRLLLSLTLLLLLGSVFAGDQIQPDGIRLMTLNVAHARAQGMFKFYQSEEKASHRESLH